MCIQYLLTEPNELGLLLRSIYAKIKMITYHNHGKHRWVTDIASNVGKQNVLLLSSFYEFK